MLRTRYFGGLKCELCILAYPEWCATIYPSLVCFFPFQLYYQLQFTLAATSVDVERVFSKGRLVLSHIRNRLTVESTRALMCLGAWSKLGLVRNADILAATTLPDVLEDDEEFMGWDYISYAL